MTLIFEWDADKAQSNQSKHGVSFEDAVTVFGDPGAITIFDDDHSESEDRFVDIGRAETGDILVVVYSERDERIRLISSRKATAREREQYERHDI